MSKAKGWAMGREDSVAFDTEGGLLLFTSHNPIIGRCKLKRGTIKGWVDYQAEVREFDAVLEHAKAVSAALVGSRTPSRSASYAEQIYVKVLTHCIMLRRLSPDPNRSAQNEFWDVPSVSAIARCAIEAHDAFMYIAGPAVPKNEIDFRILLWEAHDKTRRLSMLEAIGSIDPQKKQMELDAQRILEEVRKNPLFDSLRGDIKKNITKRDPPAFHLSQKQLCEECGVDYEYYRAVTMQLSQYVHTFPYSVHQLFNFNAGSLEALRLMALPLQFALPFLGRSIDGMHHLFAGKTPHPPSRTARSMELWRIVSSRGVRITSK